MKRRDAVNPATGKASELFTAIEGKLGRMPNSTRTIGNSSAVVNGYMSLAVDKGESDKCS